MANQLGFKITVYVVVYKAKFDPRAYENQANSEHSNNQE